MHTLLRLLRFVRPYWWATAGSVILIMLLSFFRLGPGFFTKQVVDVAVPQNDLTLAGIFVAALVGSQLLTNGLAAVEGYMEQFVGQRVIFDLRNVLYKHLQSQSMSFFNTNQTGQLMSRVTNDVSQVQFFLTQAIARILQIVFGFTFYLFAMLYLDRPLTLVAMLVLPLIFYFQSKQEKIGPLFREVQRKMADLSVVIQENVAGIKLVKAFGREDFEAQRFDNVNKEMRQLRVRASQMMGFVMPGQEFATQLSLILILVFGASRVMSGEMSLGSLIAFQTYAIQAWLPIRWLGFTIMNAQQAMVAGERIFEIIDTPFEVAEAKNAIKLPALRGEVTFENVSFAYGKNEPLLKDINLHVEPGKTVALVGPSGAGKSTLINLIPRFYDATGGRVLVDGHDVRDVTLESLRSQIGMVMQETFLFNMTVRENISYGRMDASEADVIEAARAANAHDFIMEMPQGYNTLVGERGVKLSGGQRQRIAIARAILVNPRILILDEATSSVDTRTDFQIQQALERLMSGRTTFVIAHRLCTVQHADMILVMQNGQIMARGTHQELIASNPAYQRLYDIQFKLQTEAGSMLSDQVSGLDEPDLVGAKSSSWNNQPGIHINSNPKPQTPNPTIKEVRS